MEGFKREAINRIEKEGIKVSQDVIDAVDEYCEVKLKYLGKEKDYLAYLYEDELRAEIFRASVNRKGCQICLEKEMSLLA